MKYQLTDEQKSLIRQALSLQADLMLNRKPKTGEKQLQRVLGKLGFDLDKDEGLYWL